MDDAIAGVMQRHLNVSPAVARFRARGFLEMAFDDDPYLFDKTRDLDNLDRLSRALGEAIVALKPDAMTQAARRDLEGAAIYRAHERFLKQDVAYWDMDRTPGGLTGDAALACLRDLDALAELATAVRGAIRLTKQVVEDSDRARPSLARLNLRGVQVVEVARRIWATDSGTPAPSGSDLNVAGPFGAFLSDLFEACGIEGDPRAAFRAWSREREPS